jgi:hypothetical protein
MPIRATAGSKKAWWSVRKKSRNELPREIALWLTNRPIWTGSLPIWGAHPKAEFPAFHPKSTNPLARALHLMTVLVPVSHALYGVLIENLSVRLSDSYKQHFSLLIHQTSLSGSGRRPCLCGSWLTTMPSKARRTPKSFMPSLRTNVLLCRRPLISLMKTIPRSRDASPS